MNEAEISKVINDYEKNMKKKIKSFKMPNMAKIFMRHGIIIGYEMCKKEKEKTAKIR